MTCDHAPFLRGIIIIFFLNLVMNFMISIWILIFTALTPHFLDEVEDNNTAKGTYGDLSKSKDATCWPLWDSSNIQPPEYKSQLQPYYTVKLLFL